MVTNVVCNENSSSIGMANIVSYNSYVCLKDTDQSNKLWLRYMTIYIIWTVVIKVFRQYNIIWTVVMIPTTSSCTSKDLFLIKHHLRHTEYYIFKQVSDKEMFAI